MSGCIDFQRLMHRYLDGEVSQGEKALFDRHLTICRDCAREFKALRLGLNMLASMPVPEPAPGFTSETVKKAFMAKRLLARRQKVMAWFLSGLTVIISTLILASWTIIFQPALKWAALNLLRALSASDVIFNTLNRFLSGLKTILISLGDKAPQLLLHGAAPVLYGYLTALIIMVSFILIRRIRYRAIFI